MGICLWRHYWLIKYQIFSVVKRVVLTCIGVSGDLAKCRGWRRVNEANMERNHHSWLLESSVVTDLFCPVFFYLGPIFLLSGRVPSHLRQVSDWPETLHDSSRKMGPSNNERNWDVSCHTWLGLGKKWRSATEAKRTARDMRKSIPKQLKKKNVFFTSTVVQYSDNLHK